ncbi:hypothetical protein DITRI_Ditri04bG0068700 [Diplodiscus trichospermus]
MLRDGRLQQSSSVIFAVQSSLFSAKTESENAGTVFRGGRARKKQPSSDCSTNFSQSELLLSGVRST